MATIFNFYLKFNLRCFKIFDIIFSHLVISPSAPSFNRWETSLLWSWCIFVRVKYPFWMSIEMMLMYALLESYNTGSVDITAICVNNQIESSQITWSATQQGNSKNVERQHLFRQHLCRWVFKANCASFLRWFLQTLSLACRHIGSILNFLSLFGP